jgi:hypothetical protein
MFTREVKPRFGLPKEVFNMAPQSLGRFMAGWVDTQRGNIFGSYDVVHSIQILLYRLGIYETYIQHNGTYYVLEVSKSGMVRIPNPKQRKRNTFCHANFKHLRIESICTSDFPQKVYTVNTTDTSTHTIVLDGVLTLC